MNRRRPVEPVLRLTGQATNDPEAQGVIRVTAPGPGNRSGAESTAGSLVLPTTDSPFHVTYRLSLLCTDMARRLPDLGHIDMQRVLVTFAQTRNRHHWGLQAKLVPLRFPLGKRTAIRHGHLYQVQQLFVDDIELYYVLTFYLPRFLQQSFDQKLITILHELYHIGPEFRGDIRRFGQTGSVHAESRRQYDLQMLALARKYLAQKPPVELYHFLRLSFRELQKRYGQVVGISIPRPKLIPVRRKLKARG